MSRELLKEKIVQRVESWQKELKELIEISRESNSAEDFVLSLQRQQKEFEKFLQNISSLKNKPMQVALFDEVAQPQDELLELVASVKEKVHKHFNTQ